MINHVESLNEEIEELCFNNENYPDKWLYHKFCPCCLSENIRYFFKKFNISHWICKKCNFVFVNPHPDNNFIKILYNSKYYNSVRDFIEIPRALKGLDNVSQSMSYNHYVEIIKHINSIYKKGLWLDVGGGIGNFLNLVKKISNNYQLFLNESNIKSLEFAEKYYKLKVLNFNPDEIHEKGYKFDIITILSVLEHTYNPRQFIKDYSTLLKKNGILFISIPRYSFFNRLITKGDSYNVIPPYHLSLFNEKNISYLLNDILQISNFELFYSGSCAFNFQDLLHISENYDVEIPKNVQESLNIFEVKSLNLRGKIISRIFKITDKFLKKNILNIDGYDVMNVILQVK